MILCALFTSLLLVGGLASPLLQNLHKEPAVDDITLQEDASSYTKFYLYTKDSGESSETDYTEVIYGKLSTLSKLDVNKPTKVLIHGWLDTAFINMEVAVRRGYLETFQQDVNVLSVDWSKVADNKFYPIARNGVVPVGKFVAKVVDWMVSEAGIPIEKFHIIGHSLGAHISGVVGEHVTVGKISRISGLDPAGPGFTFLKSGRLDSSDAQFVDVMHTCAGLFGYYDPCGHVDFYPNQGTYNQPGCPLLTLSCSHIRAYFLFAESVESLGFVSTSCDSWEDFTKGNCEGNTTTYMGEYVDKSARGKYYLRTAGSSPYALGGTN